MFHRKTERLVKEVADEFNMQTEDLTELIVNQWMHDVNGYDHLKEVREAWLTIQEENPSIIEVLQRTS